VFVKRVNYSLHQCWARWDDVRLAQHKCKWESINGSFILTIIYVCTAIINQMSLSSIKQLIG